MVHKAFHDSIIDELKNAENASELNAILKMIVSTKIPKNHREIIEAVKETIKRLKGLNEKRCELKISADLCRDATISLVDQEKDLEEFRKEL